MFRLFALFLFALSLTFSSSALALKAPASPYRFIFVCPFMDEEYWAACAEGIKKADGEVGTHTKIISSHEQDNYDQRLLSYMKKAIDSKPDAIMGFAGIADMKPLIERAKNENIPFIAIDSDLPDSSRLAYVGIDSYQIGFFAGETLVRLTKGKAKLGLLVSSLSSSHEKKVLAGFHDAIADYYIEIMATGETNAIAEVADRKTRAMLAKYPGINAIFALTGYNIAGAARAKQALGKKDIILLGFDDIEENLNFIKKNIINGVIIQRPYQMGYWGVRLLKEYLDNGNLPKNTFDTGFILVTRQNLDTYKDEVKNTYSVLPSMKMFK